MDEEDKELESLSYEDLSKTTTTEAYYPGLPLLAGWKSLAWLYQCHLCQKFNKHWKDCFGIMLKMPSR